MYDLKNNNQPLGNDKQADNTVDATVMDSKILTIVSNILSAVFSPLLVPTYAYAIAMWTTRLSTFPERTRLVSSLIVFVITAIIPFAVILFMIRKGLASGPALESRSDRPIPYTVTIICYLFSAWWLWPLPHWIPMFFVSAAISALFGVLINIKWKISAHATSMGGLCAAILYIGFTSQFTVVFLPWLCGIILLSGAVCSARLFLKRHTPAQVYAGWSLGFIVTTICLYL